ncbi:MAG: group I intron-associated PD-(D/E)XK endonuclease [Nanoarchaeota archaeon]
MTEKKQLTREAELRFAAELTRKGWVIYFPYNDETPVDLLAWKDGQYLRIQVKATRQKNGALVCRLKSSNNWQVKKYTKKEIDCFAIYDYEEKKGYLIPIEKVEGLTEPLLRCTEVKNNQKKGIRYAKDFLYF